MHIKNLDIKSFRGLRNVNLERFKRLNLFVGENNTGKTSILEVIKLLQSPSELGNYIQVSRYRNRSISPFNGRLTPYKSFINMFDKREKSKEISFNTNIKGEKISICLEGEEEHIIKVVDKEEKNLFNFEDDEEMNREEVNREEVLTFKGNFKFENSEGEKVKQFNFDEDENRIGLSFKKDTNLLNIRYISPVHHLTQNNIISKVIKSGNKDEVIELLKIFDKKINGLEIIENRGRPVPYIEHEELGMMPLSTFGDGVKKSLVIASNIVIVHDGVILIDEIETSIHKDALEKFFNWFIKACKKYNVQTFIATHSLEAIDAIIDSSKEYLNEIACYRLENDEGQIYVNRFPGEKLHKIRHNLGQDVR